MYQIGFKLPAANRGSGFAPRHHIALPLMVADQGLHPIDGAQRLLRQHLGRAAIRSEEHTSELQSLMRISYAVLCSKKKKRTETTVRRINNTRFLSVRVIATTNNRHTTTK